MKESYTQLNSQAWDYESQKGNIWTVGCSAEQIQKARNKDMDMVLSPFKKVPASWIRPFLGKKVLCLASGGGQQAVLLAAGGCMVTEMDISQRQLDTDLSLSKENNLKLETIRGDMQDLSCFPDNSFDLIYNPTSSCFISDVQRVYNECARVLKDDGYLFTSATNPVLYLFDEKKALKNKIKIKYTLPYSDIQSLTQKQQRKMIARHDTFEFSHTIDLLIGGLFRAGFILEDFYTDSCGQEIIDSFVGDCYFACKARKQKKQ